jgi:hypothetical protein
MKIRSAILQEAKTFRCEHAILLFVITLTALVYIPPQKFVRLHSGIIYSELTARKIPSPLARLHTKSRENDSTG